MVFGWRFRWEERGLNRLLASEGIKLASFVLSNLNIQVMVCVGLDVKSFFCFNFPSGHLTSFKCSEGDFQ